MRRILLGLLFSLWSQVCLAGVSCSLPFTLVNNTTADATQVMANYNALIACLANAASAGSNTDITALLGLTTPLNPTEGGSNTFIASGSSTGSANAQIVSSLTPNNYTLTPGRFVVFVAGFTNSGATTWAINGTTATAVMLKTASGLAPLSGSEIVAGQVTIGFYDGTQYQLIDANPASTSVQACTEIDWGGVGTPTGYLLEDGSAQSRASFPNLFNCITVPNVAATLTNGNPTITVPNSALFQLGWFVGGNNIPCNSTILNIPTGASITLSNNAGANGSSTLTIGPYPQGDCSTTFNIPDKRGRLTAGVDTSGAVLSNTACPNRSSLGSKCGSLTQTVPQASLPNIVPTFSGTLGTFNTNGLRVTSAAPTTGYNVGASITAQTADQVTVATVTLTPAGTISSINGNVTQAPFFLQPVGLSTKAIKF